MVNYQSKFQQLDPITNLDGCNRLNNNNNNNNNVNNNNRINLNSSRRDGYSNMLNQSNVPVDGSLFTRVTFKIQTNLTHLKVNEVVALVGDCAEVGNWNSKHSVELVNSERTDTHLVWTTCITFPTSQKLTYKYIIVNKARNPSLLVEWEAARGHSRSLTVEGKDMFVNDGLFGVLGSAVTPWVGRGWLPENETQLRVQLQVDEKPVILFDEKSCLTDPSSPLILRLHDPYGLSQDYPLPMTNFTELVLHAPSIDQLSFTASIIEQSPNGASLSSSQGQVLGRVFVISSHIKNKWGKIYSPIISETGIIGEFRCNYLVVTPFTHPLNTISTLWHTVVERNPSALIGHRGNGKNNFGLNTNAVTENTILSFLTAARFGARMIEFDLQLTYDNIPVIFHDYEIEVETTDGVMMKEAIHRLTLQQFLKLKPQKNVDQIAKGISHLKKSRLSKSTGDLFQIMGTVHDKYSHSINNTLNQSTMVEIQNVQHQPQPLQPNYIHDRFSTFQDAFTLMPQDVGFMVEIKYPNLAMQSLRKFHAPERNEFVDIILNIVFNEAGDRRIAFLTFDPDIATILRTKQFRYPVLFLVCSDTPTFYSVFDPDVNVYDKRGDSILNAISFTKTVNLDGIVCDSESILANHSFVQSAHNEGLLLFTYGSKNVDPANVKLQTDLGVDGIIADNITKLSKHLKESSFISSTTAGLGIV